MPDFLRALSLLTSLPVHATWDDAAQKQPGRAMAAYPLVGTLVGGLLLALAFLLVRFTPETAPLLPAALVLAAWAVLTGALHLDGWADCCDALIVPVSRERRLEILHDSRLGSFGGVGLALLLLLKLAAIQGVLARGSAIGLAGLLPLLQAPVLARWAVVCAAAVAPLARPDGMAAHFKRGLGRREVVLATLTAALICLPTGLSGIILWAAAAGVAWAVARLAISRIGGLTGDVYGATVESTEVAVLLVACYLPL